MSKTHPAGETPVTGKLLSEGKTKRILEVQGRPDLVVLSSKDDITAGDGAKHDIITGKAELSTRTSCAACALLKAGGLPVAYEAQVGPADILAAACRMLPFEVVVRREAHGSYIKRSPQLAKGHLFPRAIVEFYLKTKGKRWGKHELACDDPLMDFTPGTPGIRLLLPSKPITGQQPFLVLPDNEVFTNASEAALITEMARIATQGFLMLEKCWQLEGRRLVDYKVEFGISTDGRLLLADVIDNDAWRVLEDGAYIDKQVYRDGGSIDMVVERYRRVADIVSRFRIPAQQVIVWTGSEKDDTSPVIKALGEGPFKVTTVVCSMHKEPVRGIQLLNKLVNEVPDSVIIALIGRSNGAGPILSASTTVPVITVPASAKEFPEDVWSSLRMPSGVPVLTVLQPANAALAALQILSARNPALYAQLRGGIEKRMVNVVAL